MNIDTIETTKLEDRIHLLELEHAERKPVDKLIQILIYFLAGLSIIVGFFGIKQFSDIDSAISKEILQQFPKDQQKYLEYKKLIEDTKTLHQDFEKLAGKYKLALERFAHIDHLTADFDLEGKVIKVMREVVEEENQTNESWRLQAVATLRLLVEAIKRRNFQGDFIFNAAQAASKLQQHALAYELMQEAYIKRPHDKPIQAGRLSAIVEIGDEKEVNEAFKALMDMVIHLDTNSPHIVLSEAWNASEHLRRYDALIEAIDNLIQSKNPLKPSYAYFVKAFALTRASRIGDLETAQTAMEEGWNLFLQESPNSVWHEASLREYAKCLQVFEQAKKLPQFHDILLMQITGNESSIVQNF